jgi:transposase
MVHEHHPGSARRQGDGGGAGGPGALPAGDVSDQHIWRFLRAQKIDLAGRTSWCVSSDPAFAAKAAEIVGLYLDPPDNAVVLAVDEKPDIQARGQGYPKLPGGRTLSGFSHDYKRHRTTTVFAALDVATGEITAGHYARRRRIEFLDFMNRVVADYPGKDIHVILDNLATHKPKCDRWLSRHKNVHFHDTSTHASWLNQVEIWFSILATKALKATSFTSVSQPRDHIDDFIKAYNQHPRPFAWSQTMVYQKTLKPRFATL